MAHWRYTFKPARFFMLDARASVALLAFLLHIRVWTFLIAVTIFIALYVMERRGLDFPSALRAIRLFFCGNNRPPCPENKLNAPIDYDRRPLY